MSTVIDGIEYGPLAALAGTWSGDKGLDVAPEEDGTEENPFYESILYEAIGDVTNAGKQTLAVLRYHQIVTRKSDGQVFHNETGYWSYDAATGTVMHSLTIPRGLALLAGGQYQPGGDSVVLEVKAKAGDADWGIAQSPFMRDNAKTTAFEHRIEVNGNEMSYKETTFLEIYGRSFDHIDSNTLTKDS